MVDHAADDDVGDIFVYAGGRAPRHVTHVRIDRSVEEIENHAFRYCEHLVHVETHDGIRRVGSYAFLKCKSLRRINLRSVVRIGRAAFHACENLESAEFGNELHTIGRSAFYGCSSLEHLKLPSIITIEAFAFAGCSRLIDVELSERLEAIETRAFRDCDRLERIAIPLKIALLPYYDILDSHNQFQCCDQLKTVDLVGGIHKTATSLHMENWRNEMEDEINRINRVLVTISAREKTDEIRHWIGSVSGKMHRYKAEHYRYVKEAINLLELALWKAKLDEKEDTFAEGRTKKAKVDVDSARRERRVTCGADIVIKNVLPFLQLE